MPHGGNTKRRVNAKKKGQRDRQTARAAAAADSNASDESPLTKAAAAVVAAAAAYTPPAGRRSFQRLEGGTAQKQHPLLDDANESIYARYKNSTQRFKEVLQSMVPPELFYSDSVSALVEAADHVVKTDLPVENALLGDLKVSIRVRKQMAIERYGGGDDGHSHFIEILEYCWSLLAPRRKRKRPTVVPPASEDESDQPLLCNRFERLVLENEAEDDTDDEEDLPQSPQPRPVTTGQQRTLQELINGTDRTDAILYLRTLDALMACNAKRFEKLKLACVNARKLEGPKGSFVVSHAMKASVAANATIRQVEALEKAFIRYHPHLNTVYRVLATLVLVAKVKVLTYIVSTKSPLAALFTEKHAVEFLGDAMETAFRHTRDPCNKRELLIAEFLERWQFQDDAPVVLPWGTETCAPMSVELLFIDAVVVVALEVPMEREHTDEMKELASSHRVTSHSWLRHFLYIGSNRSIIHTVRLVQRLSGMIKEQQGVLIFSDGPIGIPWRERKAPATRIQIDMDELLVNVIMPSLISQCSHGMLSKSGILPYIGELLTGFVHVKAFVDHPERPVSWSLAFTVHTILNGVFEVQGPELDFLATTAEDSFNKFMQQVKSTEIQHHDTVLRCPLSIEKEDKEVFDWIQFLVQVPLDMIFKHEWRLLSIWNPYCAGTFLSFLAYLGNLEWGTLFVDSVSQLKVTLHLFNALKQAGAIRPSQIGLLDLIFDIFKDTKAIWEGPIPVKGQFQNRWCTMIGFKCGMTRLMVFAKPSSMNKYTRKTKQLYIDQFSKSFSRICLRHVDGAVDRHEGDEDRRMRRNPLICKLQAHTNSTMKAMSEDDFVLVPNWIRLGFVLNQFYSKLANDFGWVAEMDKVFLDSSRVWKDKDKDVTLSKGIALAFGDRILRPLDDGDAFVASRCTRAMIDFFNGIDPRDVMWYGF